MVKESNYRFNMSRLVNYVIGLQEMVPSAPFGSRPYLEALGGKGEKLMSNGACVAKVLIYVHYGRVVKLRREKDGLYLARNLL